MRGSIIPRERADGSTVFCIKYYDHTGKQRWETIGTSRREAERELAKRIAAVAGGNSGPQSRITFADFVPQWEIEKARTVREGTMENYKSHVKHHLMRFFGRKQLRQITLGDVQRFVNEWKGDPSTLRRVLATLSGIFKSATIHGYMRPLDFSAVSKPRLEPQEQTFSVLTIEEVEALAEKIDERYAPDVVFLAFTGLRRGEWIAIKAKPSDDGSYIDEKSGLVVVRKSLDRYSKIGPVKSEESKRKIIMLDRAKEAWDWKKEVKAEYGIQDSDWAFPAFPSGKMMHAANFHNLVWKPAVERLGKPELRLHDLRHTYASLLIAAGAPAHFVAQQMGHSDPAFTMRTYAHWFEQNSGGVVEQLNVAFTKGEADAASN